MSRKFLTPINLAQNEIQNAVAQVLGSAPSSPKAGQFYYDSTTNAVLWYNGSAWISPLSRANHTGTQLAATISDFATNVQAVRLDQMAAPTASVSMNSQKITNVAAGTLTTDAVNYGQLQNAINGTDWKNSVRAASTANLSALSGLLTVDGVTLVAGDRVLVKNQTTASANGIYVAASGAWTLAADSAQGEITSNSSVMVEEGTTLAGTQWRVSTTGTITVGTTSVTWTQFGASTTYTAGTGISITGTSVAVDTTVVARKYSATVGDGSSTSITVTHSLGTQDVQVQVYDAATFATVECDVVRTNTTQIALSFSTAPAASAYRVVVVG